MHYFLRDASPRRKVENVFEETRLANAKGEAQLKRPVNVFTKICIARIALAAMT